MTTSKNEAAGASRMMRGTGNPKAPPSQASTNSAQSKSIKVGKALSSASKSIGAFTGKNARNDREVFDLFRSSKEAAQEVEYLAYALFAFEKSEWLALRPERATHRLRLRSTIGSQTSASISSTGCVGKLLSSLTSPPAMEAADERALSSAIVAQVRSAGAWYKQLAMALTTAIVAPLILGGVILGARY